MTSFLVKTAAQSDAELAKLRAKGLLVNTVDQTPPLDSETVLPVATSGLNTWNWRAQAWFGPAYAVSWKAGDHVGIPTGPWPGVGHATVQGSTSHGATPFISDQTVDAAPQYDFDDNSTGNKAAPSDGSGVIFLIQTTTGYPHTPDVPPALAYNILDYLGDLVLTNGATPVPYALDDGDGADGDSFLIWANRHLYKRTAGSWIYLGILSQPQSQISLSSTDKTQPVYEGFGGPGSGTDPLAADLMRLFGDGGIGNYPHAGFRVRPDGTVVVMGAQQDDSMIGDGQMTIYFDSTPGAARLMIRAKDAAGNIVTGTLPLA